MLSKRKKRIAALITAVVLSVTAAFSLPENIRAEEVTATNSDADAETAEDEGLQEGGIAVQDLADQGETLYIHSRYWDGWYLSSYVDITATDYTPSLHGALKATDASGRETEAYCMQSTKSSAGVIVTVSPASYVFSVSSGYATVNADVAVNCTISISYEE